MSRFFVLLSILVTLTASFDLECDFEITGFGFLPNIKYCQVQFLAITSPNETITSVNGATTPTEFQGISFQNMPVLYLPKGLGKFFPKLKALRVYSCGLKAIEGSDLEGLGNLESLIINVNAVEELADDLFEFTPKINDIYFRYNEISHVGKNLLKNLDSVKRIDFIGNKNHSRFFIDWYEYYCEDDVNKLKKERDDLRWNKDNEIRNLQNKINDKQREVNDYIGYNNQKATEITNLKNDVKSKQKDVDYWKYWHWKKHNQAENLKKDIKGYKRDITNLKNDVKTKTNEINFLKATVTSKTNEIANLQNNITALNDKIENGTAPLKAEHQQEIESLNLAHKNEIKALEAKHQKNITDLIREIKETVSANKLLQEIQSELESDVRKLKAELQKCKDKDCTGGDCNENACNEIMKKWFKELIRHNGNSVNNMSVTFSGPLDNDNRPFFGIQNIASLNLSGNNIVDIPENAFKNLTGLKELDLSHNRIKNIHQNAFKKNVELETLRLDHNQLIVINNPIFENQKNLKKLLINDNKLKFLNSKLLSTSEVFEVIDLRNNECMNLSFPEVTLQEIEAKIIQKCNEPIKLYCVEHIGDQIVVSECENGVPYEELEYIKTTMEPFKSATPLEILLILGQRIIFLPSKLSEKFPKLIQLVVENSQLKALRKNDFEGMTLLKEINIERNNISKIEDGVFDEVPQLERLNLADNNIGSLPKRVFAKLGNLTSLELSGNRLLKFTADLLPQKNVIRDLQLQKNKLEYIETRVLQDLPNAELIDLSRNTCINMKSEKSDARGLSFEDMRGHIEQECSDLVRDET